MLVKELYNPIVYSNIEVIHHACLENRGFKENSKQLYINISTGELAQYSNSSEAYNWRPCHFNLKSKEITIDLPHGVHLNKRAFQVFQATTERVIASISEQICYEDTVNGITLRSSRETAILISSQESKKVAEEIDSSSDPNFERCFSTIKARFEQRSAVSEEEIKDFYQQIFNSKFAAEAGELLNTTSANHIVITIFNLYEAVIALENGVAMEPIGEKGKFAGMSQSYFLKNLKGERLWVFKPEQGEGIQNESDSPLFYGIQPGEGAKREHIASLINQLGNRRLFTVPTTAYVIIQGLVGSVQAFEGDCCSLTSLMTKIGDKRELNSLSHIQMTRISAFDQRFLNADRHGGNLLCRINATVSDTFAIDHGGILSANPKKDLLTMEYLSLEQMELSFDPEIIEWMTSENVLNQQLELLREHGINETSINWVKQATQFQRIAIEKSAANIENNKPNINPRELSILMMEFQQEIADGMDADEMKQIIGNFLAIKTSVFELDEEGKLSKGRVELAKRKAKSNKDFSEEKIEVLFEKLIKPYAEKLLAAK